MSSNITIFKNSLLLNYSKIFPKIIKNHIQSKVILNSNFLSLIDNRLKKFVSSRVCLSTEYKFYYCRIPKAANSTVVRTLAAHITDFGLKHNDIKAQKAKKYFKNFANIKDLYPEEVLNDFFCFTFVRHPDARVLSAYLDKLQGKTASNKKEYAEISKSTFRDFLHLLDDHLLYKNPHWAPQSELIPLNVADMHYIGRVENLESDLHNICNQLFNNFKGIHTRTHNITKSQHKVDHYFSSYEKELTRKLYHNDFKLFYPDDI